MALNLGKADDTLIIAQRNKAADGEDLLGRHIDRERTPVQHGRYLTGTSGEARGDGC
jgi:hypothetical protein